MQIKTTSIRLLRSFLFYVAELHNMLNSKQFKLLYNIHVSYYVLYIFYVVFTSSFAHLCYNICTF